jgi:hypothetical protein
MYLIPLMDRVSGHIEYRIQLNSSRHLLSTLSSLKDPTSTNTFTYSLDSPSTNPIHDPALESRNPYLSSSYPHVITQTACPGWAGSEAVVMTIKNPPGMRSLN